MKPQHRREEEEAQRAAEEEADGEEVLREPAQDLALRRPPAAAVDALLGRLAREAAVDEQVRHAHDRVDHVGLAREDEHEHLVLVLEPLDIPLGHPLHAALRVDQLAQLGDRRRAARLDLGGARVDLGGEGELVLLGVGSAMSRYLGCNATESRTTPSEEYWTGDCFHVQLVDGIGWLDEYGSYVATFWEKNVAYFLRDSYLAEIEWRCERELDVRPLVARLQALNSEIAKYEDAAQRRDQRS